MSNELTRVMVRLYHRHTLHSETEMKLGEQKIDRAIQQLTELHAALMANGTITMVEIEFLDDPSPNRFFRIGTDPTGMVLPIGFKLQ